MTDIGSLPRSAPRPDKARPLAVSIALQGIVIALLAGVCESLLRAASMLDQPEANVGGVLAALAVRAGIYLAVAAVALRMAGGARWARTTLALGLGVVGLASLLIEPLTSVLSGADITIDWGPEPLALGLFRVIHIVAVLIAVPAMFRAGDYFRRVP